ncbi:Cysteine synthase 2 [Vanrija albida]|uniref:Cysteine synthase 2 n=1 Tax=Vanrija albida TaxID=181172 RepID=A0ABR3Q7M4_9TREE
MSNSSSWGAGLSSALAAVSAWNARVWERLGARLPRRLTRDLIIGLAVGITLSLSSGRLALFVHGKREARRRRLSSKALPPRPIELRSDEIVPGVSGLIGNTPLVRINSLSDALGVEILGKCEFLNPGGSVKDRVALRVIEDAESRGLLHPHTGSVLFEGTVGSTGISLATVGKAKGYEAHIIMPSDVAIDKVLVLERLGATVERVPPVSIVDQNQFVNLARRRAHEFGNVDLPTKGKATEEDVVVSTQATREDVYGTPTQAHRLAYDKKPRGFFADQFENDANFQAHYHGTGPEIARQTGGHVDAFVSGAGTGGTISGTGVYLKEAVPGIQVVLADPEGSGLYNKVRYGVMYAPQESEGTKRRYQVDTVVEGIGINRITHNFELGEAVIDDAYRITDVEAVAMSRYLVANDGLFLGSSSACNLVASIRLAKTLPAGSRIVTILCDSGARHQTKFWSDEYLANHGIAIDAGIIDKILKE